MLAMITTVDETIGGAARSGARPMRLELVSETLSAREIIVENARRRFEAAILEAPPKTRDEMADNIVNRQVRPASVEQAVDLAISGFQNNEFFFFWNDSQVTDLDQRLQVLGDNRARFIRLIPLKGG